MTQKTWIAVTIGAAAALLWIAMSSGARRERSGAPSELQGDANAAEAEQAEPPPLPPPHLPPAEPPSAQAPAAEPEPAAAQEPGDDPNQPEPKVVRERVPPTNELPPPEQTGPVDELKARFAKEPRDSSARALEQQIEAAFKADDVPPGLLKSALCRRTVCRIETRWSPERGIGFMAAVTRLILAPDGDESKRVFDTALAISPEGEPDTSGTRAIDVYVQLLPPEAETEGEDTP